MVERVEPEANKVTITPEEELAGASRPEAPLPGAQGAPEPKPGPRPEPASKTVPKAERDKPNTALLVKKVRLQEGGVCGNPGYRRRGICHVHHLQFRMNGGKTVLSNTLLLCKFCHAAVHLGLLKIEGNPFSGLVFRRKSIPTLADFQLELGELASVPEIRLEVRSGIAGLGRNGSSRRHSAIADSAIAEWRGAAGAEGLLKALMKIGYSKKEALARLQFAREKLAAAGDGKEPSEQELLLAATSAGGFVTFGSGRGRRQWIRRLETGPIAYGSSPALADGVFGVFLNRLHRLDAATGELRWTQPRVHKNIAAVLAARLAGQNVFVTQ
ncbi:MAG: HNH endonuclease [Planctomycetes bacterium]|nr:HNH endonuclease [Planctomycetota bacterium]